MRQADYGQRGQNIFWGIQTLLLRKSLEQTAIRSDQNRKVLLPFDQPARLLLI